MILQRTYLIVRLDVQWLTNHREVNNNVGKERLPLALSHSYHSVSCTICTNYDSHQAELYLCWDFQRQDTVLWHHGFRCFLIKITGVLNYWIDNMENCMYHCCRPGRGKVEDFLLYVTTTLSILSMTLALIYMWMIQFKCCKCLPQDPWKQQDLVPNKASFEPNTCVVKRLMIIEDTYSDLFNIPKFRVIFLLTQCPDWLKFWKRFGISDLYFYW